MMRLDLRDDEYLEGRYATPESFRRRDTPEERQKQDTQKRKEVEQSKEERNENIQFDNHGNPIKPNMSNPYIDTGYKMPYQISQNKYKEQVFGSQSMSNYNYPSPRPEPLDGRPEAQHWNQGAHPLEVARQPPRPGAYGEAPYGTHMSPRQPMKEQLTYRSGRPDMGFEQDRFHVPYPQEPLRRGHDYQQPPEIGYDPYKDQEVAKPHYSEEDKFGPHPGWVLLLRFQKTNNSLSDVRRALTMCNKHIESDGGRILGIANTYGIRIREGGDAWVTFGKMRHFGGGNWNVQMSPTAEETNYIVLAIFYPSLYRAIQWFDRDSAFKQKDFPDRTNTDAIVLPLNSSVDTRFCKTLVFTEYPKISHPEYFRDKFSIPTEDMMKKRFKATPYIVKASSIPTDDPRQRVAKHLRGSWIKRNSVITLSLFESLTETHRYFTDPEYLNAKESQDRVSAPTTCIFDLEDWRE